MEIVSEFLKGLGTISVEVISFLGYPGVFILMAMESMIFPLPSEVVMPFAGFLVAKGDMSFMFVVLASSLGSLFGSLLSYYMGKYGGNALVLKYGKYFLLDKEDLMKTENWFKKSGESTVFISRFIPVVRHFISIPAGMGKMDIKKFSLYTIMGATLWNTFLAYLGYVLGIKWETVKEYMHYISLPVAFLIAVAFCYVVYRHIKHHRK